MACTTSTVDTYVDAAGKKRYKGNGNLKKSQQLA